MTQQVVDTLSRRAEPGRPIHIEDIQDQVELALMRSGEHKVARAYVLYREERAQERRKHEEQIGSCASPFASAPRRRPSGAARRDTTLPRYFGCVRWARRSFSRERDGEVRRNLYDGIQLHELGLAQTMAARTLVEQEPNYAYVSARLLLNILRDEALAFLFPRQRARCSGTATGL